MRHTLLALGALLMIFVSAQARADRFGNEYQSLAALMTEAQRNCEIGKPCDFDGMQKVLLFHFNADQSLLSKDAIGRIGAVATSQAQVWADTILEGDYEADETTRLDQVEGLFRGNQLIAYRLTYSAKAWYLGTCSYDYVNRSMLKNCTEGRIVESSFVTPDFGSWLRDELAYAEFIQ